MLAESERLSLVLSELVTKGSNGMYRAITADWETFDVSQCELAPAPVPTADTVEKPGYEDSYVIIKELDYPTEGIHPLLIAEENFDGTLYPEWPCYTSYESVLKRLPWDSEGHTYYHIAKILAKVPQHLRDFNYDPVEWDADIADQLKQKVYAKKYEEVRKQLKPGQLLALQNYWKLNNSK